MSEYLSENSEMSTVEEFVQKAMKQRIAPPAHGSVKQRITKAARDLGWTISRAKDAWYASPKMTIRPKELFRVEAVSGLTYARQEVRKHDAAIERATALLDGADPHLVRTVVAAVIAALGIKGRPGTRKRNLS